MNQSYSYSDIFLKPTQKSEIERREDVDTSTMFLGQKISLPVVLAPMQTVVGKEMAVAIDSLGGISFLPRTDTVKTDLDTYDYLVTMADSKSIIPSIPAVNGLCRAQEYVSMGADSICIDLANGFSIVAERAIKEIQDKFPNIKIITGNVGSLEGYEFLSDLEVSAVRVGIGNGQMCSTSIQTGVSGGNASLIRQIAEYREAMSSITSMPVIIADGGIHNSGDIVKAISLGADICMCGSLFGGCEESPGPVIKFQNRLYKQMAGQASFAVKRSDDHIEGDDTLVPYIGKVKKLWNKLADGISSACSYMNCKSLENLRFLPDENFGFLSAGAKIERMVQK